MKKIKRLICMLLAAVMIAGMAACGTTDVSTNSADSQSEFQPAVAPEISTITEASSIEEVASTNLDITLPLTSNGESFSYFVQAPGIMSSFFEHPFQDYPAWVELENRTGVHIEFHLVSPEAEMETFNLMISSGDYVDMFGSAKLQDSMDYYVEEGIVLDLKDTIEEYMPNYLHNIETYPELAESIGTESDEGYWSVLHNYTKNTTYQGGLVIRRDWLDQLGLELPHTIDQYYDVLTAFKNNLGADSALWINSSGILNNDYFSSAYDISAWYNGAGEIQYPFYQVAGAIKYGPNEEGFRSYLETMSQWYSEGLIYHDFMSYTSSNTNAPEDIITENNCGVYTTQLTNLQQYDSMVEGFDVVAAYTPVQNEGDAVHMDWTRSGISTDGLCISSAVGMDELPLLLQMWDYCCSEDGLLLQNYGIENDTYVMMNGQPQLTKVVTDSEIPALSLALNAYTLSDNAVGIIDKVREQATYSDKQLEAIDRWCENVDGAYNLPALMSLNADEAALFNATISDILTYVETFTLSCIVGNVTLNDTTWEEYLSALDSMDIDVCIAQYQSAYDRYMSR